MLVQLHDQCGGEILELRAQLPFVIREVVKRFMPIPDTGKRLLRYNSGNALSERDSTSPLISVKPDIAPLKTREASGA